MGSEGEFGKVGGGGGRRNCTSISNADVFLPDIIHLSNLFSPSSSLPSLPLLSLLTQVPCCSSPQCPFSSVCFRREDIFSSSTTWLLSLVLSTSSEMERVRGKEWGEGKGEGRWELLSKMEWSNWVL